MNFEIPCVGLSFQNFCKKTNSKNINLEWIDN